MNSRSFALIHYLVMSLLVAFFAASNHVACEPIWASDCADRVQRVELKGESESVTASFLPQCLSIWDAAISSVDDVGMRARRNGTAGGSFRAPHELCLVMRPGISDPDATGRVKARSVSFVTTLSSVRIQV